MSQKESSHCIQVSYKIEFINIVLLSKTWRIYKTSSFHNFSFAEESFQQYKQSLTSYFKNCVSQIKLGYVPKVSVLIEEVDSLKSMFWVVECFMVRYSCRFFLSCGRHHNWLWDWWPNRSAVSVANQIWRRAWRCLHAIQIPVSIWNSYDGYSIGKRKITVLGFRGQLARDQLWLSNLLLFSVHFSVCESLERIMMR